MSPAGSDAGAGPGREAVPALTRRTFVAAGGTALLLGLEWPAAAQTAPRTTFGEPQLAAWIECLPDGRVVIALPDAEMGQGVYTGLPLILADELGADWSRVEVRHSGADDRLANPMKGFQATGRSLSTRGYYALLRRVGATARVLFTQAAAVQLGVPEDELRVEGGTVRHARSGRSLAFAELIAVAGLLPLPLDVRLKPRRELALIGRDVPALDVPAKVRGTAGFAADVNMPGLRVAAIRHGPGFGAVPRRVDAGALGGDPALAVVELPDAVAVVAPDFWQASRALDRLRIEWGPAPGAGTGSARLAAERSAALAETGVTARDDGDVDAAFAGAATVSADYDVPYLAHATMEPMWEYAARAGTTMPYPWDADGRSPCELGNVYDRSGAGTNGFDWPSFDCDDGHGRAAPVGRFGANAFGVADLLGNVWEWTADCYVPGYAGVPVDGRPLEREGCERYSVRGGSWITRPERQHVTFRGRDPPEARYAFFGFRVARDLPPAK